MKLKKFLSLLLSAAMAFSLLTATAFAAAPAEEENGFFDFLLGEKYTYLYAALTWDEYWANEKVYAAGNAAASAQLDSHEEHDLGAFDGDWHLCAGWCAECIEFCPQSGAECCRAECDALCILAASRCAVAGNSDCPVLLPNQ